MKRKNRDVLFLCQFFYPEYISSATLPYDTAKALAESGMHVSVLCGYPKEYALKNNVPMKEEINQIQIKRLNYIQLARKSILGRLINYFSFSFKVLLNFRYFRHFKSIIVYSNPPILVWVAYLAKKIFKCQLIFVAYDLYPEIAIRTGTIKENGFISKLMKGINNATFPSADKVIVLSGEMKRFILKNRNIKADNISVIPNWYEDTINFTNTTKENNVFYKEFHKKVVVSYLGNMGTCQDMDTILDTAALCRNDNRFVFLLAGHGNKVGQIKKKIEENNLKNVILLDFLQGKDYLDALEISSYAVVSLASGLSGLCVPSKTYAYMMGNLSVIAIMDEDSDIAHDITETKSGIVIKNGDCEKMHLFLQGQNFESALRQRYLQKYEKSVCLIKYIDLFKGMLY